MDNPSAYTPYHTPVTNPSVTNQGDVHLIIIDQLRGTKVWVRFLSILGFIMTGFIVLGIIIACSIFAEAGLIIIPIYGIMAALIFYPSLKLAQYAGAINILASTRDQVSLEIALDKQRGFWKFIGILAIVYLGLVTVTMALSLLGFIIG